MKLIISLIQLQKPKLLAKLTFGVAKFFHRPTKFAHFNYSYKKVQKCEFGRVVKAYLKTCGISLKVDIKLEALAHFTLR